MGRNSFAKAVTAGPQGAPGLGNMDTSVYDPASLGKQLTSTTIQKTVAQMQTLSGSSGFIVNQLYQITDADTTNDVVLNIVAISSTELAPFGYGSFKNSNMSTAVNAIIGYDLSSDKTLYVQEPILNNTVIAISITDGIDVFQFDNTAWLNNTWTNISISSIDTSTIFRRTNLANCTINGGNFTGVIFQDFNSTNQGITISVPANNTIYGFNESFSRIIASGIGISGATIATTNLTFKSDVNLATHMPLYAVVKYNSGTLGICVLRVLAHTIPITATNTLVNLVTNLNRIIPTIAADCSGDSGHFLKADVTTASLGASTFDITVYGVPY